MSNCIPRCTPHPCAGHACDHCHVCDVLGVCCGSISADQLVRLEAERQHAVAVIEVQAAVASSEVVLEEAEQHRRELIAATSPALPAAPPQSTPRPEGRSHAIKQHSID